MFLMDVYNKAELKPDAANKGRLLSLLRALPPDEPTKKKFVNDMTAYVHSHCIGGSKQEH